MSWRWSCEYFNDVFSCAMGYQDCPVEEAGFRSMTCTNILHRGCDKCRLAVQKQPNESNVDWLTMLGWSRFVG